MTDHPCCFAGAPRVVFRRAEEKLLRRRAQPADMEGAVLAALAEALCGADPPPAARAAGRAIASAVTAHAATFAPASEPAYHNQRHQAEATIAMAWLCARACTLGSLTPEAATAGVLAMAGHDLQHDGSWGSPGVLEARSADLTVALAGRAGLDKPTLGAIRRVILATDPLRPPRETEADDLLCRLAQEADVFGSLTPGLGWELSDALAREAAAASYRVQPPIKSFAGRLTLLLRRQRPATQPGRELGLADAVADQIAAMAVFGNGDAEHGAFHLDAMQIEEARTSYAAALALVASA